MLEALLMKDRPRPSEWAETHLVFPRGMSPNAPGRLSFDRTPYLREILDCCLNPEVETVYVAGGSQIGKTAMLGTMLGVFMELEPSNGLWAMTSLEQVREFSRTRLMEFVMANPCLARHVPQFNPAAFSPLHYQFDNMDVKLVGVGSPANMASMPAAWVIGDEAAKYPWVHKDEAPPLQLLKERTKAFPRRFHVFTSTPTTVENEFWQAFLSSDMREYFVPCPYCGGEFVFKFSRETVVWDKSPEGLTDIDLAEQTARYLCPHCGREIYNEQKFEMMRRGHWAPSEDLRREFGDERVRPSRTTRGYHIGSLYSPFLTFGHYVRQFLECLQKLTVQTDLQNLRNSWEALPYEFTKVQVKSEHITKLCLEYPRGVVPEDYYYISVGYDPGGNETHWVACAVGEGGAMWVIDWGTLLNFRTESHLVNAGSDAVPEWQSVVDKPGIAPHFRSLRWGDAVPTVGFVDSGYMTGDIYDECAMLPGELTPTKGSSSRLGTWWLRPAGASWPGMQCLQYVDYYAKMSLYSETIAHGRKPALHLPAVEDCDVDFVRGLSGQKLVQHALRQDWRRVPDDHYGDCIKLQRVGWWALGTRFEQGDSLVAASEDAEQV